MASTDGWGVAPSSSRGTEAWSRRGSSAAWGRSAPEVLTNLTLRNPTGALHCRLCFLPLKPPVFQSDDGFAVCSSCRDIAPGDSWGAGAYRRCRAMENPVESIRVPCPNAALGCAAGLAYYDLRACAAHAPDAQPRI